MLILIRANQGIIHMGQFLFYMSRFISAKENTIEIQSI